jgi:hypothetical protein
LRPGREAAEVPFPAESRVEMLRSMGLERSNDVLPRKARLRPSWSKVSGVFAEIALSSHRLFTVAPVNFLMHFITSPPLVLYLHYSIPRYGDHRPSGSSFGKLSYEPSGLVRSEKNNCPLEMTSSTVSLISRLLGQIRLYARERPWGVSWTASRSPPLSPGCATTCRPIRPRCVLISVYSSSTYSVRSESSRRVVGASISSGVPTETLSLGGSEGPSAPAEAQSRHKLFDDLDGS